MLKNLKKMIKQLKIQIIVDKFRSSFKDFQQSFLPYYKNKNKNKKNKCKTNYKNTKKKRIISCELFVYYKFIILYNFI